MDLLREYVRLVLLDEAAIQAADASKVGLGLMDFDNGKKHSLVLFDVKDAAERLSAVIKAGKESEDEWMTALEDSIVGYVQLQPPPRGKANHASMVKASAAKQGFGPLMYDIAMAMHGPITADRKSVSPSAERIWDYYASKRGDVKKLPFDDIDDPHTPTPEDDAELHKGGPQNPLNAAYEGAKVDATALKFRAHRWLKWAEASGLDKNKAMNALKYAGAGFFRKQYLHSD